MTAIGPIVEDYRKSLGLTQIQFAEELGVDQGTVSRLERRTTMLPLDPQAVDTIRAVALHMQRPPTYFIEFRAFIVQEVARQFPDTVDTVFDLLLEAARLRGFKNGSNETQEQTA